MLKIKEIRKEKGLKQNELAKMVNVSVQTISGYETGYANPPIEILIKIADVLETTTDYLLGRESDIGIVNANANLAPMEENILTLFRSLNKQDQFKALGYLQALAS